MPIGPSAGSESGFVGNVVCWIESGDEQQDNRPQAAHFGKAFAQLPADQREALLLVGAEGFSYDEAAEICGCAVGTIKSRVNRARAKLTELLGLDEAAEIEA